MSRLFAEITRVAAMYEGFIEQFIGDGVMVIFGMPRAHEDDPVRAVHAALHIHAAVATLGLQWEGKIGRKLLMHSGISTGLVVTASLNPEGGTYGISGETVNLASRLEGCAGGGEVVVDAATYQQTNGYFTFTALGPRKVKGKTTAILCYRVLAARERPRKVHRSQGLRSALIGREKEMVTFAKTVELFRMGKGAVISVCGAAGTGKSRLAEAFRASLEKKEFDWREGYAYAHAQNISYGPFRDLLNQVFRIEESDALQTIQEKVESGIDALLIKKRHLAPYVGSLYSISYPETNNLDPELCKSYLHEAIKSLLEALARRKPTVFFLEDLHFADPSSQELFYTIISEFSYPALFIFTCRPAFSLTGDKKITAPEKVYQKITLHDLSSAEIKAMLYSLLKTTSLPSDLERFLKETVEGNPFYLEEIINSFVESGALVLTRGNWKLTREIRKSDLPLTVRGVIAERVDRLEPQAKRILQEASVIGKSFPHAILSRITSPGSHLTGSLEELERLDLVRVKSPLPDLEYDFKHALTQEVIYNSLLKKERQEIHERIGQAMEKLFPERLTELSETLAFHFERGESFFKAVTYLMHSGKKSLRRYAVEESHQYYKKAYELLLSETTARTVNEAMVIELVNAWAPVFYYRGTFRELEELLQKHRAAAESLQDSEKRGMFHVWLGMSLWGRENFEASYHYLHRALDGDGIPPDRRVSGYAHTWLAWTCVELGLIHEALTHGEKARQLSLNRERENCPYFQSWDSDGYAYWALGANRKIRTLGTTLLEHGEKTSSLRCITWGHTLEAWSHMADGDFSSAIRCSEKALQVSADPLYTHFPRLCLGMSYLASGNYEEAKEPLMVVSRFAEEVGCTYLGTPARCFLGAVLMAEGHFRQGWKMIAGAQRWWLTNGAHWRYAFAELLSGELFSALACSTAPIKLFSLVRNLGFLLLNLPFAERKAVHHYCRAIDAAHKVGAEAMEGQAYLGLGYLYRGKGKRNQALHCFASAMELFKRCGAKTFLRKAEEGLKTA